ncbi:MAG: glycosyltransferase family 9 protein, partial [Candidatus Marinimicrobia bacterium]|nr:glycosyltransferase family 9 protein [Candidatus Neomarinimicrobiota bacterium]
MDRALVIRFSSIGDIILSTPVVKALKAKHPELHIDYLVHEKYAPLVDCFDPAPDCTVKFPASIMTGDLPAFSRELAKTPYDLVVDLHDSLRSKVVRKFLRQAQLAIYRKPRLKRWLLFNLHINRYGPDFDVVREYLRYSGLDDVVDDPAPALKVDHDEAERTLQLFGLEGPYLVCVPGAAWPQKSWPTDKYVKALKRISEIGNFTIVLIGGPADDLIDTMTDGLPGKNIMNLKGQTSLAEALHILSRARLTLGSDTGLVHASEALGVPVVLLLGPTSRETGAACHHPDSQTIEVPLWCRPY